MKKGIKRELTKKKNRWNDELKGIITKISEVKVLNQGIAKINDDSPFLHYQVRYNIDYLRPEVG